MRIVFGHIDQPERCKPDLDTCQEPARRNGQVYSQQKLLYEDQFLRGYERSGIQSIEIHTARETARSIVRIERNAVDACFLTTVHECRNFLSKHVVDPEGNHSNLLKAIINLRRWIEWIRIVLR